MVAITAVSYTHLDVYKRQLLLHLRRAVHPPRADVRGDPALAPDHLMDDRARADHHVHGLRVRAAARPVPDTRHDCGAHPRLHLGRRRHLDVRHRPAALSGLSLIHILSFCAPFSVGFNYIANPEKYAIVADILRGDDRSGCMSVMDRAADVEDAFRDLLNDLDIATGLSNYGVKREDLPACADRAFAAKRLLNNNPRAASRDQILALLEANFEA